jgi:hypothetical protein
LKLSAFLLAYPFAGGTANPTTGLISYGKSSMSSGYLNEFTFSILLIKAIKINPARGKSTAHPVRDRPTSVRNAVAVESLSLQGMKTARQSQRLKAGIASLREKL